MAGLFQEGEPSPEYSQKLAAVRDLLTVSGRTLAQGALGWILARSPAAFPLPGFKSEAQVRDNTGALEKGPLPRDVMDQIDLILEC